MTEASELRAAVGAVGAFRDLSEANLSRLIAAARRLTFEAGEALMTQGEPSEHADFVLEGEIVVTSDSAHGAIPISRLSAPCLVGELGALAQLDRTATVRALRRVKALRIERSALLEAALASPTLLIDVIGRMGERLRRVNGAMSLYTHALAALSGRSSDRNCSANCAIRCRISPTSARLSIGWPSKFCCGASATTKWRPRRSSSARCCPTCRNSPRRAASMSARR